MRTTPNGYVGRNHETIGSDILAVLKAVSDPAKMLDPSALANLRAVQPNAWYPISMLLELMDRLEAAEGATALRLMGFELFRLSHAENVKKVARSARDILFSFDRIYRSANRGEEIGGWKVVRFEPGIAEMEKNTPHHCVMEEGILAQALATVGAPSIVSQTQCIRRGAGMCRYVVESSVTDERWTGSAR